MGLMPNADGVATDQPSHSGLELPWPWSKSDLLWHNAHLPTKNQVTYFQNDFKHFIFISNI